MRVQTIIAAIAVAGAVSLSLYVQMTPKRLGAVDPALGKAFQEWAATYGKVYNTPTERNYRRTVFAQNVERIAQYNKIYTHRSGLNFFSDMTHEEFSAMYTKTNPVSTEAMKEAGAIVEPKKTASLAQAKAIDWRTQNAVTPIKSEGNCKAHWAFAATSTVESAYFIAGNILYNLSEQQIIDCSYLYGNNGCTSGNIIQSYLYLKTIGGQMQTSDYPYTQAAGKCAFKRADIKAKISGFAEMPADYCHGLLSQTNFQTVSTYVYASPAFAAYTSGIFNVPDCGTTVNLSVTVVGYGTDSSSGETYWIVRNSWGANWGEGGYIRMDRTVQQPQGICGICMYPAYPIV